MGWGVRGKIEVWLEHDDGKVALSGHVNRRGREGRVFSHNDAIEGVRVRGRRREVAFGGERDGGAIVEQQVAVQGEVKAAKRTHENDATDGNRETSRVARGEKRVEVGPGEGQRRIQRCS
jgi:hypothetical protein